ncbi:isoamyl acetate-hydrolyzing esterase 1 homolog isoform X2 [Erinaceus europaeus]|uniref:Isoamyl acetate-hydrolyzing esterase 1 homolog n=1 Tax=Erinaceus europaeus TaxID=9365 RepID=A0ABM3X2E1_ERIEU|nr:isoamyl acetate-hydrolyzing esterase 1 homolog isoform X2 [Erinaceus europaeus]
MALCEAVGCGSTLVWPRVLLFGDSITQFSFQQGGWGASLADKLVRKCDVLNRGFSGYNTRWAKIILPRLIRKGNSLDNLVAVTIFFGANDSALKGCKLNRLNAVVGEYASACLQVAQDCGTDALDLWTLMQKDSQSHVGAWCQHYKSPAPGGHFWVGQIEIERERHLQTCFTTCEVTPPPPPVGSSDQDPCTVLCTVYVYFFNIYPFVALVVLLLLVGQREREDKEGERKTDTCRPTSLLVNRDPYAGLCATAHPPTLSSFKTFFFAYINTFITQWSFFLQLMTWKDITRICMMQISNISMKGQ